MESSAFDLQQARVKQVLFKSRLRSMLYGVREPDEALFSRPVNPLGQWLDTVVKPRYGQHPEVREIELVLQQMLGTGRTLVAQYQNGLIEESRTGLDKINAQSDHLNILFDRLSQRLVLRDA